MADTAIAYYLSPAPTGNAHCSKKTHEHMIPKGIKMVKIDEKRKDHGCCLTCVTKTEMDEVTSMYKQVDDMPGFALLPSEIASTVTEILGEIHDGKSVPAKTTETLAQVGQKITTLVAPKTNKKAREAALKEVNKLNKDKRDAKRDAKADSKEAGEAPATKKQRGASA